jgi:serine/threonine protein kinase
MFELDFSRVIIYPIRRIEANEAQGRRTAHYVGKDQAMRDTRVESIFNAALLRGSPEQRNAYLDGACGDDAALRASVEKLLRADESAAGFLQTTSPPEHSVEGPGSVIGRYKLLQQIGEGGFGVVYMAEQIEPVRRKVALKVIKLGMDTKQVVARFESERQALAMMEHLNIAKVLDAGTTELPFHVENGDRGAAGRPYFVMELVKGIPITEYCDQNNLSTKERLELFIPVCHAVQHAHQKGVIHRDLKPSNILVTLHDGRPVPKVIDFGIAKATNQRLTEKTYFTEFRQFIGTPQYTSPEQAEMSGLDVDTRSDIYSLGVVLYELLTGSTPFEAETLRAAGYAEMQRIIREEEPPSPSVRVSTSHAQLATLAKHRNIDASSLSRQIRGDLDWIVMKALEKDRTRRYDTASDLARDVQRYLSHEPVQASPPRMLYKLQKFVRRNKLVVTASLFTVAAVVIGLALASAGMIRAQQEAERATGEATRANNEAQRANQESSRATAEAARNQAIADYLQEILGSVDPEEAARRNVDVERTVRRARELFGNDHATVAATLSSLALQLQHSGDMAAAERLYRESVGIWRAIYGEKHANVGITLGRLGSLLRSKGDDEAAEQSFHASLQIYAELPNNQMVSSVGIRTELAEILKRRGKLDEAETLVREALQIQRSTAKQDVQIANTLEQLLGILSTAGKDQEAEQAFEEVVAICKPLFPPDSLTTAWHNAAFGIWLHQRGRLEKSESYLREALRIYRNNPNPPREYYLTAVDRLFQIMRKREDATEEAIALFHEAMENMGYVFGRDHLLLAPHLFGYATELESRDRTVDAIPLVIDGIRIYRKAKGDDWDPGQTLQMLDRFVRRVVLSPGLSLEKYATAETGCQALLVERPQDAATRNLLGMTHYRLGRYMEAIEGLRLENNSSDSASALPSVQRLAFLSMAYFRADQVPAARATLEEARRLVGEQSITLNKDTKAILAEAESLLD